MTDLQFALLMRKLDTIAALLEPPKAVLYDYAAQSIQSIKMQNRQNQAQASLQAAMQRGQS